MNDSKTKVKDKEALMMVVEILHTGNWLDNKISKILGMSGITHVQFNILRILQGANPNPLSVGEVKSRILFSNSDITRLLDRLKDKGLIQRTINPINRRRMDVSITDAGLELIQHVLPCIENELDGFFSDKFTKEEKSTIIDCLKRIREH